MFHSSYLIKITGKDNKRFIRQLIKQGIYFENLNFTESEVYIKIDEINYLKLKSIKTTYKINIIRLYGLIKIKDIIKKYFLFFVSLIFGIIILFIISNVIFEIEVVHSKKEIRELLIKELTNREITKYKMILSFDKKEAIVKDILNSNKSKLEWIEIERIGTKYFIRVEERVISETKENTPKRHIVAKKDGIILDVEATKGEIVKKVNNYVHKGDIIISGFIKKNESVIDAVSAEGIVFAETWYKVNIEVPKYYYEEIYTGRKQNTLKIRFLNNNYNLFDFINYRNRKSTEKMAISDYLGILKIGIYKDEEVKIIDEIYTTDNILPKAYEIGEKKLKDYLGPNDEIISQKKLKMHENNSTIEMTLFYKAYEDITDTYIIKDEDYPKEEKKE